MHVAGASANALYTSSLSQQHSSIMPRERATAHNAYLCNIKGKEEMLLPPTDDLVVILAGSYS